jgi:hypothetical protein
LKKRKARPRQISGKKPKTPKKVGRANTYLTEPHPEMPAPSKVPRRKKMSRV